MTPLRVWLTRIAELFRRRRVRDDAGAGIEAHLAMLADDYIRRGYTPDVARQLARREFGGADLALEMMSDARGFSIVETIGRDVRHSLRWLAATPIFTGAVIATLALGIGANTAIFSLMDAVVLRPLPYADSGRLVSVWEVGLPGSRPSGADTRMAVAPANLADYRRATSISLGVFASTTKSLTEAGPPERVLGETVTADYFTVLGAQPAIGRVIREDENHAGADGVIVLSDALWRQRFGADPNVIGRTATLDRRQFEVIGVMPPEFRAVTNFAQADAGRYWIPITFDPELLANRLDHEVQLVGRLTPGVTAARAREELQAISAGIRATMQPGQGNSIDLAPLNDDLVRDVSLMVTALFGGVTLILVIASLNVANLLIVESLSRRREAAVRLALGASRARLVGQLVTQSLVLSSLGGLAGLVLAWTLERGLVALAPPSIPHLDRIGLDGRVLAFTALTSITVGLIFGLLPLRSIARTSPADVLKQSARVVEGAGLWRWRSAVMIAEVALSIALLIGAGLMARSLAAIGRVDLGFDPHNVLAASVTLPESRYPTGDARFEFFEKVATRVAAIPGVTRVAFGNRLPLRGSWSSGFAIENAPPRDPASEPISTGFQAVSANYFTLFDIALRSGRLLESGDRIGAPSVAVVSENFAAVYLNGQSTIGHRLRRGEKMPWITIVGVVSNVRRDGRLGAESPQVYLSAAQTDLYPLRLSDLAVRTSGDAGAIIPRVRDAIWSVDPTQPITNVRTLDDTLVAKIADRRFQAFLFAVFSGLACLLTVVGVYSVVSYAVAQRRPEIGLRIALGADRTSILRWLVGQIARLVVIGAIIGLALARALSGLVSTLLFGVTPTDVVTYAGAALLLSLVAIATTALIVNNAAKWDPTVALRGD